VEKCSSRWQSKQELHNNPSCRTTIYIYTIIVAAVIIQSAAVAYVLLPVAFGIMASFEVSSHKQPCVEKYTVKEYICTDRY
jgi:hypothetical protein